MTCQRALLFLLGLAASGCVINPAPPGVDVSWTIARLDGSAIPCPADWATAVVIVEDGGAPPDREAPRFACDDLSGVIPLPSSEHHKAWVEFRDRDDAFIAASLPIELDTDGWHTPFDVPVYVDAGFARVSLAWNGEPWCSPTFNPFELIWVTFTGPTSVSTVYDCDNRWVMSSPLAAGTYSVSVHQGFSSHATVSNVSIEAPNRVTDVSVTL